jgi:hypothetical protein
MDSHRQFDEMVISSWMDFNLVEKICEKFGAEIKVLHLTTFNDPGNILKNMPNIEKLIMKPGLFEFSDEVNLKKLKLMKIVNVFRSNFLESIAACDIEEFYFIGIDKTDGLAEFLRKQTKIKKLQISMFAPLHHLELTHLKLSFCRRTIRDFQMRSMLMSQTKLEALDIDDDLFPMTDEFFNFISENFQQLKVLKMNGMFLSEGSLLKISNFYCLKELCLNEISIMLLPTVGNLYVERLTMSFLAFFTKTDLKIIGQNFPNVKVFNLKLHKEGTTCRMLEIVESFPKLEVLRVYYPPNGKLSYIGSIYKLKQEDDFFPNLKVLHIYGLTDRRNFSGDSLVKLLNALPNVVNLKLEMTFKFGSDIFMELRNHYKLAFFDIDAAVFHDRFIVDQHFAKNVQKFVNQIESLSLKIVHKKMAPYVVNWLKRLSYVESEILDDKTVEITKNIIRTFDRPDMMEPYDDNNELRRQTHQLNGMHI